MAYRVAFSREARQQAAQLPLPVLARAIEQLERDPWQGSPYQPGYPPEYRVLAFGTWGMAVYVIAERTATVTIVDLLWAG